MSKLALDPARTALVCVEFQREWLAEDGVLFERLVKDKAAFRRAVDTASEVLAKARESGWTIAHAGLDLRHDPHYRLFAGGAGRLGLAGAIPKAGTWTGNGADYVPPFLPQAGEFVVKGRSGASVLTNSTLDPFCRHNGIDTLLLMGFATHVCIESSMRDAHDRGYRAIAVRDACAGFEAAYDAYFAAHVVHHFGESIIAADLPALMGAARINA